MAGVVLVIALTASLFTLNRSFQVVDAARNDTLAAQIMQSEIERLRLMSWNDLVLLEANVQAAPEKRLDVDLSKIIPDASLRQRFENTQVTLQREAARDMMRITVTVRWTGHGGIAQERSFTTKYSRNGFYDYCYTIGHS